MITDRRRPIQGRSPGLTIAQQIGERQEPLDLRILLFIRRRRDLQLMTDLIQNVRDAKRF